MSSLASLLLAVNAHTPLSVISDVDDSLIKAMHTNMPPEHMDILFNLERKLNGALVLNTNRDGRTIDKMTLAHNGRMLPLVSEVGRIFRLDPQGPKTYLTRPLIESTGLTEDELKRVFEQSIAITNPGIKPTYDAKDLDGMHLKVEVKEIGLFLGVGSQIHLLDTAYNTCAHFNEASGLSRMGYMLVKGKDGVEVLPVKDGTINETNNKGESIATILATNTFQGTIPIIIGDSGSDIEMMNAAREIGEYIGVFVGQPKEGHPKGLNYIDTISALWEVLEILDHHLPEQRPMTNLKTALAPQ